MKCANCETTASHEYKLTLDASLFFCEKHIPTFLRKAQKAGLLPVTEEHQAIIEEGLQGIIASSEPIVDEPIAAPKTTAKAKKTAPSTDK